MEDLDAAIERDDYGAAKALIEKIAPNASKLKDDTAHVEFLNKAGSTYYRTAEYQNAEDYFLKAAEKASATLGENEYHYALAIFNLASVIKK